MVDRENAIKVSCKIGSKSCCPDITASLCMKRPSKQSKFEVQLSGDVIQGTRPVASP